MIGALLVRMKARQGCALLNSRDVDEFLRDWRDDARFIYPGLTAVSGEHRGKKSIKDRWIKFYDQFPESHFTIRRIYVDRIMSFLPSNRIAVEWEVEVTTRNRDKLHNHGVSLVNIHNGKIQTFEDIIADIETLEKAWSSN